MTNEQPILQGDHRDAGTAGTADLLDRMSPPGADAAAAAGVSRDDSNRSAPLLEPEVLAQCRERWEAIQSQFVDGPRDAVRQADELVAETLQELTRRFAHERSALEEQWARDDQGETEQLRLALQQYRSFFQRLLAA